MKQEFDYAGNEIKEGDEFVWINILRRYPQFGMFIPDTRNKGLYNPADKSGVWLSEKKPDEECFEISEPHKVIVQDETMNELGYFIEISSTDGYKTTCYNTIESMIVFSSPTSILAIKGISDSKEYYDTWKQKQQQSISHR